VEGFVRAHFAEPERLQARVADAVLRETGMQAQVLLTLDEETSLDPIRINKPDLRVRVKDYDEEQELDVRVTLEVDEQNQASAVLHFRRNLEMSKRVLDEVGRHLRRNVTLQEFCEQLSGGAARERLVTHLNGVLVPAGRRVGALELRARAPQRVESSLPLDIPVRCKVHEFPDEIVIKNTVLPLLQDLARYRMAGSPPLAAWLQKKLNATIPQLLFDTLYIDLLINFSPIEECNNRARGCRVANARGALPAGLVTTLMRSLRSRCPVGIGGSERSYTNYAPRDHPLVSYSPTSRGRQRLAGGLQSER
jgi:hypothetical protein